MADDWQQFLRESYDVTFDPLGYSLLAPLPDELPVRTGGDFVCDLSHLSFARAAGADAVAFLNGQLTNDLRALSEGQSQVSGFCTPQGRLLGIIRLHRDGDGLLMQSRADVLPGLVDRMRRYVLRAAVQLAVDPAVRSFGAVGRECALALGRHCGPLPDAPGAWGRFADLTVLCHSGEDPVRYQVVGPGSALAALWSELSADRPAVGSWAWASFDVAEGLPVVFPDTSEQFVPQHLNMDITGGVSFRKGCFPGQEVVARMRYLGKLKTRMALAHVETSTTPSPGDRVYPEGVEQSTGMVVNAAPAASGYDILATVRLAHLDSRIRLRAPDGVPVRFAPLPYPLENPEQKQA